MILPLATFVGLAATCMPSVAPETLAAVAGTEWARFNELHGGCSIVGRSANSGGETGGVDDGPERTESVAGFRHLVWGGPDVVVGEVQVLPACNRSTWRRRKRAITDWSGTCSSTM